MATWPQPHTATCPTESPSICFQILSLHEPFSCRLDLDTRRGDLMLLHTSYASALDTFFCLFCLRRKFSALFRTPIYIQSDQTFYTLLPKSHSGHDLFAVSLWDCLCPVKLVYPPFPPVSAALKPFWLHLLGVVWGIGTLCLQVHVCVSVLHWRRAV